MASLNPACHVINSQRSFTSMNLNQFTNKAQEAVLASQSIAQEYNHSEIEPMHLLLALLRQSDGVVPQVVAKIGTRPETLIAQVEQQLSSKAKVYGANQQVGLSLPASDALTRTERQA